MIATLIYEFPFGILGGYVCGWIGGRSEIKHCAALAIIGISSYVILLIVSHALTATIGQPLWYHLTSLALLTVAVLLGGWLRARQKAKNPGAAQTPEGAQT